MPVDQFFCNGGSEANMLDKGKDYGATLDRIIEKYTSTPKSDPELIDYSMRPRRKKSAGDRKEDKGWVRNGSGHRRWHR